MTATTHARPRHWLLRRTPTDIPFYIIVFQTVLSLVISPLPQRSLQAVWPHVLGLALFFVFARLSWSPRRLAWIGWGLVTVGTGIAGIGFLGMLAKPQVLFPGLRELVGHFQSQLAPLVRRVPDSFHPNVVAGAVLLTFPFLAVLAWRTLRTTGPRAPRDRVAIMAAAVVILPALLVTQSRAAYLGAAAAMGVLVALGRPRWLLAGIPTGLTLIGLGAFGLGWRRLAEALVSSDPAFGLAWRVDVWQVSRLMAADFCFTGVGFGCFEPVQWLLYPLSTGGTAPHAHNLFLQVAIDLGVPGAAAYAVLIAGIALHGVRRLRGGAKGLERALLAAGLAAMAAMLVQGVLDAATWGNKGAFLPWAVLGLTAALASNATSEPHEETPPEVRAAGE